MFSVSAVPDDIDMNGMNVKECWRACSKIINLRHIAFNRREAVILAMARKLSVRHGQFLNSEMRN